MYTNFIDSEFYSSFCVFSGEAGVTSEIWAGGELGTAGWAGSGSEGAGTAPFEGCGATVPLTCPLIPLV